MTPKKSEAEKKAVKAPVRKIGTLVCEHCDVTAPNRDGDEWPLHRCGYDIRPFTRWEPLTL